MALTAEEQEELRQLQELEGAPVEQPVLSAGEQTELDALLEIQRQENIGRGDRILQETEQERVTEQLQERTEFRTGRGRARQTRETRIPGLTPEEQLEFEALERQEKQQSLKEKIEVIESGVEEVMAPILGIGPAFDRITEEVKRDFSEGGPFTKFIAGLRAIGAPAEASARALVVEPADKVLANFIDDQRVRSVISETLGLGAEVMVPTMLHRRIMSEFVQKTPALSELGRTVAREAKKAGKKIKAGEASQVEVFKRAVTNTKEVADEVIEKSIPGKGPIELDLDAAIKRFDEIVKPPEGFRGNLGQDVVDQITEAGEHVLQGRVDKSRRIFQDVAEALDMEAIQPEAVKSILERYNISSSEFAAMWLNDISTSARKMARLSKLSKALRQTFKDDPEALALFDELHRLEGSSRLTLGDRIMIGWRRLENFRRGMLVTQLATAVRNSASQTARIGVSSLDEGIRAVFRGEDFGTVLDESRAGAAAFVAMANRMSPKGRDRFFKIIGDQAAELHKAKLFGRPVHEVVLANKTLRVASSLNNLQENFFRKVGFEAKMRTLLRRANMDWDTVDPKDIPERFWKESVEYALEMSFAADPKGQHVKNFVNFWKETPLTTVNPFPRFAFGNALPFVYEHSPLGFLSAFDDSTIKALASGRPEEFARKASRALIGTLMMETAFNIRTNNEVAGEKWYEIKAGDKTIDTRAFAPFSTYMLFAEAALNPSNIKPWDWAQAAIGLNRISGSGLAIVDLLRGKNAGDFRNQIEKAAGQYASGFTVAARTAKDMVAQFDDEEAVVRDLSIDPGLSPTLNNFPFLSQALPEAYFSTQPGIIRNIEPGVRQLTGLTQTVKTDLRKEVDRLGIDFRTTFPRTGLAEVDRLVNKKAAPLLQKSFELLQRNKAWPNMGDDVRRLWIGRTFSSIFKKSRKEVLDENPELANALRIKRASGGAMRQLFESLGLDVNEIRRNPQRTSEILEEALQNGSN